MLYIAASGSSAVPKNAIIHFIIQKSAKDWTKSFEKDLELRIEGCKEKKRKRDDLGSEKSNKKEDVGVVLPEKLVQNDSLLEFVTRNPQFIYQSHIIEDMIRQTSEGLTNLRCPIRSSEGTGGAYFMQNSTGDKIVSIFKPADEEPNAENNPHGLVASSNGEEGLKKGTKAGEGAIREVVAYLLDHPINKRRSFKNEGTGFAGVPPTSMVKCLHAGFNHPEECKAKFGSLQKFVENYGSCEEMGPCNFPVHEVHKISILDIRMANADRHAGNILISKDEEKGQYVLVPIDHGYCLPESFEDCTFEWLYWPQARQSYSPETLAYIKSLDAEEDIATLKFYGWDLPQKCARTLRVSTMLLKKGAEQGLTPYTIGSIMCRDSLNKPSILEEILHEAQGSVLPSINETTFLDSVSRIMDRRLAQVHK
uniref:1-phosphatidylinositol 4-kinase n=1 Tax=Kalanchoe fedtschenkoi TaxID=63787 RepID=A0A7N0UFG0_KALFE